MDKIWQIISPYARILILGFGREGQSTYQYIRAHDATRMLTIADQSEAVRTIPLVVHDEQLTFVTGESYLATLADYDLIIQSPGISLTDDVRHMLGDKLTSQADLFLRVYRMQTIGITGTKGKSTTSAFTYHILKEAKRDVVLLGNIGTPPFDMLGSITEETTIVYELSSHMLQGVRISPHIAILLNIFPEHLDYYGSMQRYTESKAHIFMFQNADDILIVGNDQLAIEAVRKYGTAKQVPSGDESFGFDMSVFSTAYIKAPHVLRGMALGARAAMLLGVAATDVVYAFETFHGLPHRLETVGTWRGITFINDSISTIPESAIAALRANPQTNLIILGGMDRGILYEKIVAKVTEMPELIVVCIDDAGKRIFKDLEGRPHTYLVDTLEQAVLRAYELLPAGGVVLLSPAAASYTMFKNFEERGQAFAAYAAKYGV